MADPRFYENRGPFTLAAICQAVNASPPSGADGQRQVFDLASLTGAGPEQLAFFAGGKALKDSFLQSRAGFCLVPEKGVPSTPDGMTVFAAASVQHAWARIAALFYPEAGLGLWAQEAAVSPDARLAKDVKLGPGVVIGAGAEIGEGTRIGANAVIAPGVAIGRNCEIGANVSISHAYIGDGVLILPGAQIGQPGFGFASSGAGHAKILQLGRVIIQDRVEVGSATAIDRGALGDTVIGEGTKIDNLVQIGHNVQIGRNCVLVSQVGIAGSSTIEDFAVLGGQVGVADHVHIGAGARLAARTGAVTGQYLAGGRDYGGTPAKPIRQWAREIHALNRLTARRAKDQGQDDDG